MLIFLGVLYNLALPYWDTLKKRLAEKRISSLTIIHSPNLIGHPIGIVFLVAIGLFVLPTDPIFYLSWFGLVVIAAFSLVLNIWGLVQTKFFGVQILGRLGFLMTTIAAIVLLDEKVTLPQVIALFIATLAIIFFAWPKRISNERFVWDKGIFFVILSLIIGAFSTILYKVAALHAPTYTSFLSGRFVADLVCWTIVWIIGLLFINKLNPIKELGRVLVAPEGRFMIVGISLSNLVGSWLIYELPVVTVSILGTLIIPGAYLCSHFIYKEKMTIRMWIGTVLSVVAIALFLG